MKKILFIISILSTLKITAQVHQFGGGIGQVEGFDELKYEGFYSYNYKLLYTKLNYVYTPKSTYEYKHTSQTILFLGIQSHPDFKLIGHVGLGARGYFPTKNEKYELFIPQDEPQINLFFNTGATYEFIKHNCLHLNLYIGSVRREIYYRNYKDYERRPDYMITIGYAYTFRQKSKASK